MLALYVPSVTMCNQSRVNNIKTDIIMIMIIIIYDLMFSIIIFCSVSIV